MTTLGRLACSVLAGATLIQARRAARLALLANTTTTRAMRTAQIRIARAVRRVSTLRRGRHLARTARLGGPMQTVPRPRSASNAQQDNLRRQEARLARLALPVNTTTTRAMQTAHLRLVRAARRVSTLARARRLASTALRESTMTTPMPRPRVTLARLGTTRPRPRRPALSAWRASTMTTAARRRCAWGVRPASTPRPAPRVARNVRPDRRTWIATRTANA